MKNIHEEYNSKRLIFTMNDHEKNNFKQIELKDIYYWNIQKFGIFKSVNIFNGARRKECLEKIISFYVDMDGSNKRDQLELIKKINLEPSEVVESKNGFHVYWFINEQISVEDYEDIAQNYFIPAFKSDIKCKDVTRVLRYEGTYHWKDINDPFMCKLIYRSNSMYNVDKILKVLKKYKNVDYKKNFYKEINITGTMNNGNIITAEIISNALGGRKLGNNSYQMCCPAHDERNPSFTVTQYGDKVLCYCHARCSQDSVIEALRGRGLWHNNNSDVMGKS